MLRRGFSAPFQATRLINVFQGCYQDPLFEITVSDVSLVDLMGQWFWTGLDAAAQGS
jgi:hypothetical protein